MTKTCERCRERFEVIHSTAKKRRNPYCSRECGWAAQKAKSRAGWPSVEEAETFFSSEGLTDAEVGRRLGRSPWWVTNMRRGYDIPAPVRRVSLKCEECGEEFEVGRSEAKKGRRFCSTRCRYARDRRSPEAITRMARKSSITRRGEGNPAWKGEDTPGSIYRVFNVRLKGEKSCRNCGTDGLLHLHHIVPRDLSVEGRRDLRNGITLCPACHLGWHRGNVVIKREVLSPDEWSFISSLEIDGCENQVWLDAHYPSEEGGS